MDDCGEHRKGQRNARTQSQRQRFDHRRRRKPARRGLGTITDDDTFFAGLFDPWAPPGPGIYNGVPFTSGRTFKINSTLPIKWGYRSHGALVDSSTSTPVVNIYGPLFDCGDLAGPGSATRLSDSGPGSTTMTYDPTTMTWQQNVKLSSPPFVGDIRSALSSR
jgi:hypothetical protein